VEGVVTYRRGVPEEAPHLDLRLGGFESPTTRYTRDGSENATDPGRWRARHRHHPRLQRDEVTARRDDGSELSTMATLRTWSEATGRWEMTFLIAHQPQRVRSFSGTQVDGEMHLEGEGQTLDGRRMLARVRFFGVTPEGFEWENRVSLDSGTTWYRDSTISARRVG
jgi:hypothetical protein